MAVTSCASCYTRLVRVLVVDDHEQVRSLVGRALTEDGHVVRAAATLAEARALLAEHGAEVIVLDIGLPDGSGLDLCTELRLASEGTPILLLTARVSLDDRVAGLDRGADDFLGKPFAIAELRARVRALGRRGPLPRTLHHRSGPIALDFGGRTARVDGVEVPLTAREWAVLELLAQRSGRVVARAEILEIVWGEASEPVSRSLDVMITRIRRKLGEGAIRTLRGEGYALG